MGYEKSHDGVMNYLESTTQFLYGLDYLEYCNSVQYLEMSKVIYKFLKAASEGTLEEEVDL